VLSALTHPKVGEIKDAEELFLMIERDSHEQVKQAAARGTAIHKAIENFIAEGVVDPQYEPYITAVRRELFLLSGVDDRHAWRTEVAVTHPYGFGGRIDLVSEELGWTVDLKGKEFGVDDEIKGYSRAVPAARRVSRGEGAHVAHGEYLHFAKQSRSRPRVRVERGRVCESLERVLRVADVLAAQKQHATAHDASGLVFQRQLTNSTGECNEFHVWPRRSSREARRESRERDRAIAHRA
jgi:hypothetical protein